MQQLRAVPGLEQTSSAVALFETKAQKLINIKFITLFYKRIAT